MGSLPPTTVLWSPARTPRRRCRKVPRKESVRIRFSRNRAGEGNPRAYSNDLDSTACINHVLPPARILRCNGSSDEQPAAPQMRRLRSNSACLYADHAGRCYGGATLAYPIPVRHPKFHHGGGIGELAMRLLFNHRSSKVWHRLASFQSLGR